MLEQKMLEQEKVMELLVASKVVYLVMLKMMEECLLEWFCGWSRSYWWP